MSRPPWFPFYPNDYDADTAELSLEQDGFYWRMLRRAWTTSPDGCSLPADESALARVLGTTLRIIRRHRDVTRRYFVVEGSRLISNRLREEASKATKRSDTATLKGRLGGRPKKSSSFNSVKPTGSVQLKPTESDSQSVEAESKTKTVFVVGTDSGAEPGPAAVNGGPAPPPAPVGQSATRLETHSPNPEAVHRLVAAGVDSQVADRLVAQEADAQRRYGAGA